MSVQVHHVLTEVYVLIVSMHLPVLVRLALLGIDAKSVSICDRHPIVIGKLLDLLAFGSKEKKFSTNSKAAYFISLPIFMSFGV